MDKSWIDSIELEKKKQKQDTTTQNSTIMCEVGIGREWPQKDVVSNIDKSKWETLKKFAYDLMHGNIHNE